MGWKISLGVWTQKTWEDVRQERETFGPLPIANLTKQEPWSSDGHKKGKSGKKNGEDPREIIRAQKRKKGRVLVIKGER